MPSISGLTIPVRALFVACAALFAVADVTAESPSGAPDDLGRREWGLGILHGRRLVSPTHA